MKKLPMDWFWSQFAWYRSWCGGTWYHTIDLPNIQGGFDCWNRGLPPWTHILLETKNYS